MSGRADGEDVGARGRRTCRGREHAGARGARTAITLGSWACRGARTARALGKRTASMVARVDGDHVGVVGM